MRDDDVVEKARDSFAGVSSFMAFPLLRASLHAKCRVRGHGDTCGVRVVVRRVFREKRYGNFENPFVEKQVSLFRAFFRLPFSVVWISVVALRRALCATMAERRVLCLLGPCRVDGVGGGVGYEDLRGVYLLDVEGLHHVVSSRSLVFALKSVRGEIASALRSANDRWWAPLGLHAPTPKFACVSWWPDLVLPKVEVPVAGAGSKTASSKRKSAGAESETKTKSAAPDERWFDAEGADMALRAMACAAERTTDQSQIDDEAFARMTNPAGAAARAVSLLGDESKKGDAKIKSKTDVAWITAGVDGGGGGGGEWPPEAVAAHGVMSSVVQSGGKAVIVVLLSGDENGDDEDVDGEISVPKIPPLLLEIAKRAGATLKTMRSGETNETINIFSQTPRWQGGLTLQSRANSTSGDRAMATTTLPGFALFGAEERKLSQKTKKTNFEKNEDDNEISLALVDESARGASGVCASTSYDSSKLYPRTSGAAVLLEVVRLECVPADRRRDAPSLRFEMTDYTLESEKEVGHSANYGGELGDQKNSSYRTPLARLRDELFTALASATNKTSALSSAPGFLVRVPFDFAARKSNTIAGHNKGFVVPHPHGNGPILLIRTDGSGGFNADALATLPQLLTRVAFVAEANTRFRVSNAAQGLESEVEAGEGKDRGTGAGTTPASVASTGRKRTRNTYTTKASRRRPSDRQRNETSDDVRMEVDDDDESTRERALEFVAETRVERSLVDALEAVKDRGGEGAAHRKPAKHNADAEEDVQTGYPEFARVLEALLAAQRLEDGARNGKLTVTTNLQAGAKTSKTSSHLTSALLRAAHDTARGREVVSAAIRDARGGGNIEKDAPDNAGLGLAIVSDPGHPSRSQSKSGTDVSRECAVRGPNGVMDLAAAEAELKARAASAQQRERRERRERQRITMAPRHVPAARRTGNTILAAATGKTGGGVSERNMTAGDRNIAYDRNVNRPDLSNQAGSRENKSGSGLDERGGEAPEPSESAVGAGANGVSRNRVCTNCHIELAPIPGVNMALMKHCYACGGALGGG